MLGLSGGIDSALVATIAADALGPDRVHVVLHARVRYSSGALGGRRRGPGRAARRCTSRLIPITPMIGRLRRPSLRPARARRGEPAGPRPRHDLDGAVQRGRPPGARPPATRASWRPGTRPCTATRVGGFAPIKDVPKTLVWALARWRNEQAAAARSRPRRSRRTPSPSRPAPSSRPASSTADSLPDYEVLDRLLDDYVERDMGSRRAGRGGSRRRRWSSASSGWWTAPSTSGGSTRRARRSPRRTSAGTGGCRSRTAGASPGPADRHSRPDPVRPVTAPRTYRALVA